MREQLPTELHKAICQELWLTRLETLDTISLLQSYNAFFANELALQCTEEVYANGAILFEEGEVALAAYMVIHGMLQSSGSKRRRTHIQDNPEGTWVGDEVFYYKKCFRKQTVTTMVATDVMKIMGSDFHALIERYSMKTILDSMRHPHRRKSAIRQRDHPNGESGFFVLGPDEETGGDKTHECDDDRLSGRE